MVRPKVMSSVTTQMLTSARPGHVGAPAPDADADAHEHQDGDDGPAPVVVELPAEEPAEDLPGAVAVLEPGALQNLVARRVVRLRQQRHDDPGRRQQRAAPDHRAAPQPPPQVGGDEERPDDERHHGQIARLVVQRHRQHDEQDGREHGAQRRQGAIGVAPGQRQRPHRPQLRPHAVADPDVGLGLVADAGGRGQERGDGGRRCGRPAAEAEEASTPVHGQRPQRQQQVHGPPEHGVRIDERADEAREDGGQALVVQVLR